MISIENFISGFNISFSSHCNSEPWDITSNLSTILIEMIAKLNSDFEIKDGIAIHKSAIIEQNVVLKAPIIINANCFISANSYLRDGVFIGKGVKIGAGCEIKSSAIFNHSAIAHFNYIGDSLIGNNVNFEAGSITANHFNERTDKKIRVIFDSKIIDTNVEKFGALVGDNSKIGANAVLSPGTLLYLNTIVKRLELIDQISTHQP